jgi:drug/metabolite transporter (DMT)-like permease
VSLRGWSLFVALSVIWGVVYLFISVALKGVSTPVLVFLRTGIGAAILLPLVMSRRNARIIRAHWLPLVGFAFFEIIAAWSLLTDAQHHIPSSLAGLLIASTPIIAAVLDRVTGGTDRWAAVPIVGFGVGLAGIAMLVGTDLSPAGSWPVVEVLLVATCYAIGPLIASRYLADVPPIPMTAACLGLAAVVYALPAARYWPDQMPSAQVVFAIATLAIVCTALAFIGYFALIHEIGAARALLVTYVNPAVALVAGVAVLDERLTSTHVVGLGLTLIGSALAARRPTRKTEESVCQSADLR